MQGLGASDDILNAQVSEGLVGNIDDFCAERGQLYLVPSVRGWRPPSK